MPLKKFCPKCGCIIDINKRYCDKCQQQQEVRQKERHKEYDQSIRYVRDKKYHDFYISFEWEQLKIYLTSKYNGLCLWSYFVDKKIVALDMFHHIVPLKENWNLRLSESNIIPLSDSVHGKIERLYKTDKAKKIDTQRLLRESLVKWDSLKGQGV